MMVIIAVSKIQRIHQFHHREQKTNRRTMQFFFSKDSPGDLLHIARTEIILYAYLEKKYRYFFS